MPGAAQLRVGGEPRQLGRLRHVAARLQRRLRSRQTDAAQIFERRDVCVLQKKPRQMSRRGVALGGHARHVPVELRLGADSILHPVQRGVQVIAVGQKWRQFGIVWPAAQRHHHGLRHLRRQGGAFQSPAI